jgi:two-component system alkaline phosphatase synthesis response regulator PhoP
MSKILIADDESFVVEMLGMILRASGHEVLIALNGQAAIDSAKKEKPQIIFLDICFPKPGPDGVEILEAIRALDKDVKVVITSGLDANDERYKKAQALGANKFLSKPLNVSNIKGIIQELTSNT